jgi:uncharacterized membrane protein
MKTKSLLMSTAVSSLLALGAIGASTGAFAADQNANKEKCYGIADAGKNDCAGNGHSCQGQASKAKDPGEWKYVDKGSCATAGGKTAAPAPAKPM